MAASAMLTTLFKDVVEPLLNSVFDGRYDNLDTEWNKIFSTETALPRSFETEVMLYGTGPATEKNQGQPIDYDAGGEQYVAQFINKTYAQAFAMSEELISDGEHIKLGSTFAGFLGDALLETKEQFHADFFNNAITTNLADGVPLLSSSHPFAAGGTFSNQLATPADISEASLEQLLIQIRRAKNARAIPIKLMPKQLIVAPDNMFEAERILGSNLRVATNNNDINAVKAIGGLGATPQLLTRLTLTSAYFIQTNAPKGAIHKKRWPVKRGMEGDFLTNNMRWKAYERYSANIPDPRGFFGSVGV